MSIWGNKSFYASSDIDLDIKVYIGTLQLRHSSNITFNTTTNNHSSTTSTSPSSSSSSKNTLKSDDIFIKENINELNLDEAYLSLQIIDGGIPLHPFARSTGLGVCDKNISLDSLSPSSSSSSSSTNSSSSTTSTITTRLIWNEWITLPIKIRELPPTAQLIIRLWTLHNLCIGGGSLKLFNNLYQYQRGYLPITLWYTGITTSSLNTSTNTTNINTPLSLLLRSDNQLTTYIKALEKYTVASSSSSSSSSSATLSSLSSSLSNTTLSADNGNINNNNSNQIIPWIDRLIFSQLQKELIYYYHNNDQATTAITSNTINSTSNNDSITSEQKVDSVSSASSTILASTTKSIVDNLILGYGTLFFPLFTYPILYEDIRYDGYDENTILNNSLSGNKKLLSSSNSSANNTGSTTTNNTTTSNTSSTIISSQQNHQLLAPPLVVTPSTTVTNAMNAIPSGTDTSVDPDTASNLALTALGRTYWTEQLSIIYDPEEGGDLDNPADNKYHKLARNTINSYSNPYLKPNRVELTKLQNITNTPQDSYSILGIGKLLNPEARDLIWKFRYTLTTNKKGALPFILAIDWDDEEEIKEASVLLQKWVLIDIEDALRLLCPQFTSLIVRKFAIKSLKNINDSDLSLFLLQLVQALRYEPSLSANLLSSTSSTNNLTTTTNNNDPNTTNTTTTLTDGSSTTAATTTNDDSNSSSSSSTYRLSPLADFLLERCSNNLELGIAFHWFLRVNMQDARAGTLFTKVHDTFMNILPLTAMGQLVEDTIRKHEQFITRVNTAVVEVMQPKREKVEIKIDRLNKLLTPGSPYDDIVDFDPPIIFPLNSKIYISGIQQRTVHIFKSALYPAVVTLRIHPESHINWLNPNEICGVTIHETALKAAKEAMQYSTQHNHHHHLHRHQIENNNNTNSTRSLVRGNSVSSLVTINNNAASTNSNGTTTDGSTSSTIATGSTENASLNTKPLLSSNPSTNTNLVATIAEAVKTAMPSGVAPATYKVIFKNGDDMRQDQLIIQMIRLLDAQLKRVGLDLCLTPYAVLATSMSSGVMEMVLNSLPVSAVVEKYRNNPIQSFFRESYPSSTNEFGIQSEIMDTYIKSCAGYCVITYLLGIGDRHLDNIMLTRDGHFFHLDFGYIFGKDPKPLPPPMRITKEMIDGMGGPDNPNYNRFRSYCCQAYNILRRSATLITVLLSLMRDAGIDDLHPEPMTTIAKLYEKFRVDIDDEAADTVFLRLVDDSVAAMFPAFFEMLHKIRVALR